ncbi:MAG: hypothetical protein RDV48_08225 [Candidatus Eremiobacteraeota bacterium]|nr:hypothetical protein [Candidatus Eremiobacteraeota bacterium]
MILGISHITLISSDLQSDITYLKKFGYSALFREEGIPDQIEKRKFLSSQYQFVSMAFCQSETGIPIELIHYRDTMIPSDSSFVPLFEGAETSAAIREDEAIKDIVKDSLSFGEPLVCLDQVFGSHFIYSNTLKDPVSLNILLHKINNYENNLSCWCSALGCKVTKNGITGKGTRWGKVGFGDLFNKWRGSILLYEADYIDRKSWYLDDAGITCISFISTNIKEDRKKLQTAIMTDSTGIMDLTINRRKLHIEIFENPTGGFFELLQVANNKNRL